MIKKERETGGAERERNWRDMEKYKRRVTEIAAGLRGFSPSQDYERYCRANWVARTEQYTKHHSAYTRLKNVFKPDCRYEASLEFPRIKTTNWI